MRTRHLVLLAAGALLATAPAPAQDRGLGDRREGHGPAPGGDRRVGPDHGDRPDTPQPPRPPQPPAPPRADAPQGGRFGGGPGWMRPAPGGGGDARADRPGDGRLDRGARPDRGGPDGDRGRTDNGWHGGGPDRPDNGWRAPGRDRPDGWGGPDRTGPGRPDWRRDPGHDWRRYREDHGDLFHAPRYVPPRGFGYGYRRFAPGFRIQPFFYGRDYWLDDPAFYDLPPAYGPYRWVRYYDDVLLVDMRSGIVVDVIRGFFW